MAVATERGARISWLVRLAPWLLIGGLVLFHAVNNWIWLSENVTSTGWDKPRHLARSLSYAQMLSPPSAQSLFQVMISDPVRPPFFPASASIMYWLFGKSADVATMINVIYMAIALVATYGIGQRWGRSAYPGTSGIRLGLVSVLLLAIFPMFFAMSRYFYLEFAVTAMVALTVYLLLETDGFQRRGMSLLFGLVLGMGLLTKRTFVVFAAGPILVVILTSGLLPALWQRLKRRPCLHWKQAVVALVVGGALAALWYLPNQETVRTLVLGDGLFLGWWTLAALAIYFISLPSAPLSNALSAVFLAVGLASTWYLARIEFLERVALYGYGIDDPRGRALQLDQLDTYLYYLRKLGNEHLSSAILALFAVVLLVAVVVYLRRQGSLRQALRRVCPEGWVVLAWAVGGYAALTLSIYQETRALTPALPAVALIFGAALLKIPWRWVRWGTLALILVFGMVQFSVVSYEPVYRLLTPGTAILPGWGRTTSFAQGVYIQLPDEGRTDSGFAIYPDVLERMEQRRQELDQDLLNLGLLVNMSQINAGPFNYLILTEYPNLRVQSLSDRFDETSPYAKLFGYDYMAVKQINSGMNPSQEEVVETILEGPPRLFDEAFELETSYHMPAGDTVYLYRQRHHLPKDYPVEYVAGLAQTLSGRTREGDAILLTPPALLGPFVANYDGGAEVYALSDRQEDLADIVTQHKRVFVVVGDPESGEVQGSALEWLSGHAFRAGHEWADSLQVLTFGTVSEDLASAPEQYVGASLAEQIELVGYDLPPGPWQPGDILPLSLFWRVQAAVADDYTVFVHLLSGDGQIAAQSDSVPAGATRLTSSWPDGELVVDHHGLLLPDDLPAGEYQLIVGMYLPATGDRLVVVGEISGVPADGIPLDGVKVTLP
jgi:4-amino-4-deoxy-L-arabinose transferase-like glycosyltransferase